MELRPIRLGLVIDPETPESLCKAIRYASVFWGGQTFPIFLASDSGQHIRDQAIRLGVDTLVACDASSRSREIARMNDFTWFGFGKLSELDKYGDRPLSIAALPDDVIESYGDKAALFEWNDDDELSSLLTVMYGQVGRQSEYESMVYEGLSKAIRIAGIPPDSLTSRKFPSFGGPLLLGMNKVKTDGHYCDSGIAIVDTDSVGDLAALWNLRAYGNEVVPWSSQGSRRVTDFFKLKVTALSAFSRLEGDSQPTLTVFSRDRLVPEDLKKCLDELGWQGRLRVHGLEQDLYGPMYMSIGSGFGRYFDVDVVRESGGSPTISIPLPQMAAKADHDTKFGSQFAAARVTIRSEYEVGERVTFRAPAVRALNDKLRWAISVNSSVVRGVGDGVVVGYSCSYAQDLTLGAVDTTGLVIQLLKHAGFEANLSDAGRWSGRIIEMLGGAESTLAAQPSIRHILDLASREGGANPEELHNAARRVQGKWEDASLLWRRGAEYHQWAVRVLAARKLIDGHLTYTCGACGLLQRLSPNQIQPVLVCNDCEREVPLSLQVVLGTKWVLKTRSLLTQSRLRSTFPIAATLLLFRLVENRGDSLNLCYSLGLDLKRGEDVYEIDFGVLLHDSTGPVFIIGESKARNNFDDGDIDNLEAVQEAIRAVGVECFIVVSNSKESLTSEEVGRLRRTCERRLPNLNGDRASGVNFPIVLTRGSLTVPDLDDEHPLRRIGNPRTAVAELAEWSIERELGFEGLDYQANKALKWRD